MGNTSVKSEFPSGESQVGCYEKIIYQRVALEQVAQDNGHGPELPEFKMHFGQCSQIVGLDFGWCCIEPEVGLTIFVGPFQDTL